jgi:orotate phosphoribosyltransferase
MFNQSEFNDLVISNNIIKFSEQPITLKSGRVSHVYVNWRTAANDAFLLDQTTNYILGFLQAHNLKAESIYGVPEGATKTAVITSLKLAKSSPDFAIGSHSIPFGRAKPKEHGDPKDRFFVGAPRGRTIVLEDVTTTGGSLIETIDKLKEIGVEVIAAITLTNRMEKRDDSKSVAEAIRDRYKGKIAYFAMSTTIELLPLASKKQMPSEQTLKAVEREFQLYGVKPILLT